MQDTSHYEHIATRRERIFAVILDLISLLIAVAFKWLGDYVFAFSTITFDMTIGDLMGIIAILAIIIIQIVLVINRSQTIGKSMLDIQVVDQVTEKRIGFWRYYLLRDVVGRTLIIGTVPIIDIIFQPIYFIVDSLFIFRKNKRTIHDLIAGTKVIHLEPAKRAKSLFDFSKL